MSRFTRSNAAPPTQQTRLVSHLQPKMDRYSHRLISAQATDWIGKLAHSQWGTGSLHLYLLAIIGAILCRPKSSRDH